MKLLEWVLDFFICEMVNIDEMQFGCVPGRGTTDTIFIVRQLQEKYSAAQKLLYFAIVDLGRMVGLKEHQGWEIGCARHPGQCPEFYVGQ